MLWRFSGRKIAGSSRFVIKRVFDGGDGVISGGKSERSSDNGVRGVELEGEERRLEMVPVLSGGSEDFVEFMMNMSCWR
jgi:hypothetical protein